MKNAYISLDSYKKYILTKVLIRVEIAPHLTSANGGIITHEQTGGIGLSRLSGECGQIELVLLLLLLVVELIIKSGGGSGLVEHHHEVDGGRVRVVALREVVSRRARTGRTQAGRSEL